MVHPGEISAGLGGFIEHLGKERKAIKKEGASVQEENREIVERVMSDMGGASASEIFEAIIREKTGREEWTPLDEFFLGVLQTLEEARPGSGDILSGGIPSLEGESILTFYKREFLERLKITGFDTEEFTRGNA